MDAPAVVKGLRLQFVDRDLFDNHDIQATDRLEASSISLTLCSRDSTVNGF